MSDKKNVYMVQINAEYSGSIYLPYAVGAIAAYAWSDETVKKIYRLMPFIYRRDDIDETINSLDNPYLIAFSGYIWNIEYNLTFAEKLKKKYPDCIVVFGGHSTPETAEFLKENNNIDITIVGEGEEPFKELLLALNDGTSLEDVSNIFYKDENGTVHKSNTRVITSLDYPSPYLEGLFDKIVDEDKSIKYSVIIETNRGCPYKCAYCDWGSVKSKVRFFPLERVFGEIEWLSEHSIDYCFCADANFGMFERDRDIVDFSVKKYIETGYPQKFHVNYAKNSNEEVYEINEKLNNYGMSKGATLSFQSFSEEVLENIGRTNMTFEHFSDLMSLYNENNIMTYSELILGLPGETYESFSRGLGKLLEAGQHVSVIVFNCYLLVNSKLAEPEYMKKHKIETVPVPLHQTHCVSSSENEGVIEHSQMIVSTASMNREMFIKSEMMAYSIECFHCFGLLQCFAIYLYFEHGIKYEKFYEMLNEWLENNPESVGGKIFAMVKKLLKDAIEGNKKWQYFNKIFGDLSWPFEEGMFLEIAYNHDEFYEEIKDFLLKFNIDEEVFEQLFAYQKNMLKLPGREDFVHSYDYDFYNYFNNAIIGKRKPLEKKQNTVSVLDRNIPDDWERYGIEVVWYGRRGGKSFYENIKQEFEI